jgi:hypothetical protein
MHTYENQGAPAVDDPTPLALISKTRDRMLDPGLSGRVGMHRKQVAPKTVFSPNLKVL